MREIMLTALTKRKDETGVSYERISNRIEQKTGIYISVSKLQRIFTGQQEPTVQDYELIAETGLEMDLDKTYAKVGKQEVRDSEEVEFMGAKALMDKFAEEKERIHTNYETRIKTLVEQGDKRQQAFTDALKLIGEQGDKSKKAFADALKLISEQYRANANYLTDIIIDNEAYIRDLLSQTERANMITDAAQKRAEESDERADSAELENRTTRKKMYKLFAGMLAILIVVLGFLMFIIIADVPHLGGGNLPR